MSKYKVKFKLQGLEFEIEGEKDVLPNIAGGIKNQLASLMAPVDLSPKGELPTAPAAPSAVDGNSSRRKSASRRPLVKTQTATVELPKLTYDPSTQGSPVQSWKAVDKAYWLLRVLTDGGMPEISGTALAEVFEKHFRRKGSLRPSNISRDFGKASQLVAENTNVEPPTWYLLDAGIKHTDNLIAQALQPHEVAA